MLTVALTGGIASGKSVVCRAFEALGVAVSDADVAARRVTQPGSEGLAAVVAAFGPDILATDDGLDRARLRALVFDDDSARRRLEAVLHPRIRATMDAELDQWRRDGHVYAIAAIPLLIETGQADRFDRVLVVDAPEAVQIDRLRRRDGCDRDRAMAMLAAQAGRWERLGAADDVIANGDAVPPPTAIDCQVRALDRKYRQLHALNARNA